jgi:hypothetical protein
LALLLAVGGRTVVLVGVGHEQQEIPAGDVASASDALRVGPDARARCDQQALLESLARATATTRGTSRLPAVQSRLLMDLQEAVNDELAAFGQLSKLLQAKAGALCSP